MRMLKSLVQASPHTMSAGDIATAVGATASRASFHLANLAEAGLITSERHSREVLYQVSFDQLTELTRFLLVDCCSGRIDIQNCC